MTSEQEGLWLRALSSVLERSHLWLPEELAPAVAAAVAPLGIRPAIYVVDDEQRALRPVPADDRPAGGPLSLEGTVAGRAFRTVRTQPGGTASWWVPIVNGTDRLGVIEFAFPGGLDTGDEVLRRRCEVLAGLVGHLITVTVPKGDFLLQARRARPMSASAELLDRMLPPLTVSCERLTISAILEPRYDVGGDGYDYALDGSTAWMSVFDGVGHGLRAGLAYTVAVVAIRAARRAGAGLAAQVAAADAALLEQFGAEARFVTAVVAELNLDTGDLRYVNAGHPAPLVLRGGKFVEELPAGRRTPLGVPPVRGEIGHATLRPGDWLLFYTDGITEARNNEQQMFGTGRLIEHAERHAAAGLAAPETLRRLAHAVAEFHEGSAVDDATLLLAALK
ncbi:PP2C family protein-serine/threonine phosphatase [Actinoplanes friuliensis]|uniref:Putative magnesium/manganese-dependent protein phosphatase n=1 Tax=Actinoplanes friuliensis DSM 7358 TaxID=1246995 RepID=U5W1Z1_9ACTN|nr:PP2C family protein-serine/threonine phosphatase [Actinoplanes friuliensis]AGZ43124.1 putative magnesium/manganese-dependent protein phosphatase [Actinoplanes friuliensis DSM 7358]